MLSQVRKPRFVLLDTMDLWINVAKDALVAVIGRVDMLTLNESEARLLTDVNNLMEAAEKLLKLGPQYVLIKKGASGNMLFSRKGKKTLVPAYPVRDVVDTTGAGDAFNGGFLTALLRGFGHTACLRLGNFVGTLSTRKAGGLDGLPALSDVPPAFADLVQAAAPAPGPPSRRPTRRTSTRRS